MGCRRWGSLARPIPNQAITKRWPQLTEEEVRIVSGRRHRLIHLVSAKYELGPEAAYAAVNEFVDELS